MPESELKPLNRDGCWVCGDNPKHTGKNESGAQLLAHSAKRFKNTPTKYASAAAVPPTKSVDNPDRHHDTVDHLLLIEPMMKKTKPVRTTETRNAFSNPNRNGSKGTTPQIANALKVAPAALQAERGSSGNPYSSVNIVRIQRSLSEVISSTTRS